MSLDPSRSIALLACIILIPIVIFEHVESGRVARMKTLTAIQKAAANGNVKKLTGLLDQGRNIDDRGTTGLTPLMYAAGAGHENAVEFLISSGADVDLMSRNGHDTALFYGCKSHNYNIVELLLKSGATPNHVNVKHLTPLMFASQITYPNIIQLLLQQPYVDVNFKTDTTALHEAVKLKRTNIAAFLLMKGADMDAKDAWGRTPRELGKDQPLFRKLGEQAPMK